MKWRALNNEYNIVSPESEGEITILSEMMRLIIPEQSGFTHLQNGWFQYQRYNIIHTVCVTMKGGQVYVGQYNANGKSLDIFDVEPYRKFLSRFVVSVMNPKERLTGIDALP